MHKSVLIPYVLILTTSLGTTTKINIRIRLSTSYFRIKHTLVTKLSTNLRSQSLISCAVNAYSTVCPNIQDGPKKGPVLKVCDYCT